MVGMQMQQIGLAEKRVIDVSQWEFSRLHQTMKDLRRQGWRVDCELRGGGDAGALKLVMWRELSLAVG
jgi:hypothetical protein